MGEISLGLKSYTQFGPSPDVPPLMRGFTEDDEARARRTTKEVSVEDGQG
jgi:hypothetical protein